MRHGVDVGNEKSGVIGLRGLDADRFAVLTITKRCGVVHGHHRCTVTLYVGEVRRSGLILRHEVYQTVGGVAVSEEGPATKMSQLISAKMNKHALATHSKNVSPW